MNANDIMTSAVVTVRPDASVSFLARLLLDDKISAVPVVDDHSSLAGIMNEGDLLGRASKNPKGWWLRLFDDEAVCRKNWWRPGI
jgi:CBS-domain-containing membrane protein